MSLKLSILDQTFLAPGESTDQAFQHTVKLAQVAEKLGYYRFWVSEHHDSNFMVGSSPEVLISYLLAKTERIRVGSGGVMLQHYSPYKVAENSNVLSSLAPGRVDLGIGRAPGGLPFSVRALQQDSSHIRSLEEKLVELQKFITNQLDEQHPLAGLIANPIPRVPAPLFFLGASSSSAKVAANLGLPYVFAQFLNNNEKAAEDAFITYHTNYDGTARPYAMLAVPVIVADTDEEAEKLASECKIFKIHLESGKTITVSTQEHANEYERQAEEKYEIEVQQAYVVHGSKETVRNHLLEAKKKYGVDEYVIHVPLLQFEERLRSFTLLMEAVSEIPIFLG